MSPARFRDPATAAVQAGIDRVWADLGAQVRTARLGRRWSTERLAAEAGTSRWAVYLLERGEPASVELAVRLLGALGLRLEVEALDPRKRAQAQPRASLDLVHAAMGELEVAHLRAFRHHMGIDEPYQHYQFSGRADVVAWSVESEALLHLENRTQFPNIQESAGAFNAKKAYLAAEIARRAGVRSFRSVTHVLVCAWTSEVLHALRIHPETFRSLAPDPEEHFRHWWDGDPPTNGTYSTLVVLDPLAVGRRRQWIGLEDALSLRRPRYTGYADLADHLRKKRSDPS